MQDKNSDQRRALYLELLKRCLANTIYGDPNIFPGVASSNYSPELRESGRDWPAVAHTMIGIRRLNNLQECVERILSDNIPGDLIETGVWRGGASIFMRGILKAYEDQQRIVWVADSFEGLPRPDPEAYPADAGDEHHAYAELAVPLEEVEQNFRRYDLFDAQVRFVKGWFRDTLPSLPARQFALIRLDGDMYESTMIALESLYPKLSPGGFAIIDDYGAIESCRRAVDDFRDAHEIFDTMHEVDWTGVYWIKRVRRV
jgi:O-methyltransferase